MMIHASVFSGIGAAELAAEKMKWKNAFHCEINPFGQKTLKYYWPYSISYEDIKKTDFSSHRGRIGVLTGGFPCQPYSTAGLRRGKEDERHLWPEMLRAIREIQPRWVVGENVRGLVNWNGGLVFDEVQSDLEAEGYEVQSFILPAASVNAPHKRERIWFVAFNPGYSYDGGYFTGESKGTGVDLDRNVMGQAGWNESSNNFESSNNNATHSVNDYRRSSQSYWNEKGQYVFSESSRFGNEWPSTNTTSVRFCWNDWEWEIRQQCRIRRETCHESHGNGGEGYSSYATGQGLPITGQTRIAELQKEEKKRMDNRFEFQSESDSQYFSWANFPTQSPICSRNDGISSRLVGITFPKFRTESIKAAGNAIVHQVIIQIFKAIEEYENLND